jgi:hypothetical protein
LPIKITLTEQGYDVAATPPDVDRPWQATLPMAFIVRRELESQGCDIDVVADALSAADPDWRERELLEWRGAEIMRSGKGYVARCASHHGTKTIWQTAKPMTAYELFGKLLDLGCHQSDIMDSFDAADPNWAPEHDREAIRAREAERKTQTDTPEQDSPFP